MFSARQEHAPSAKMPRYRKIPWFFWRATRFSSRFILFIRSRTSTVSPWITASIISFSFIRVLRAFTAHCAKAASSIAAIMTISGRRAR